jgi:kinesin family protein C2/C3
VGLDRVRERETLNINQSLSVLGKVFLALLNKKSQHIPYRDSKLTHYLKDSLGGQSKTMLILQVSPAANDSLETVSTLNFG